MSAVIIVSLLSVAAAIALKCLKHTDAGMGPSGMIPMFLVAVAVMLIPDVSLGGNVAVRLLADLSAAVLPFLAYVSSLAEERDRQKHVLVFMIPSLLNLACILLRLTGLIPVIPDRFYLCAASAFSLAGTLYFLLLLFRRVGDVHAVMMSGTVWSGLCLSVDAVYALFLSAIVLGCAAFSVATDQYSGIHVNLSVLLLCGELCALGIRILLGSVFVIRQKQEMLIVESMKISQIECNSSNPRSDEVYKDIYERVVLHFEMDKPYLDGTLTINDVVKVVYSNKVYISKAICHYTGRNFCQFVNYYRVIYSMDLFRETPSLKVTELAVMSGFNCTVSYTTAFRLFMNETPSEWCRKERTKLLKMKK